MKLRLLFLVLVVMFCSNAFAEDIPNPNDVGMRKVQGVVIDTENVSTSRRGNGGGGVTGNVAVDVGVGLLDAILNTNYVGFPIYHVKVNENISLEVAS